MSIDTPDKTFHAERELQNLKLKNAMLQEFADNIKKQLQDAEESLQKSRHEYYEVLQNRDKYKFDYDNLNDEIKRVKDEKLDLFEMLKKKNSEITQLKASLQNIQSIGVTDNELSRNTSMNDIKMKEIELTFLDNRLRSEKALYENRLEVLTQELDYKTDELMNCRKEKSENSLQASMKIEEQANEINSLRMEINRLRNLIETKDKANEELSKKFEDLQVNCAKLEGTFQKETEAQNDIISLLMKRNEDLQKESESKNQNIEELREMLKKGYEAHQEIEIEFKTMKESYINDVKELEDERENLAKELERAKMCMTEMSKANIEREFEKHFPFASETNRQLNNRVNLSDLYDELVRAKQELARALEKTDILQSENDALKEKINEDKPVIYKHMQEFGEITQNYEKLENEVLQLTMEKDKYVAEKDEDTRLINTLQREIKRYEQENADMSLQISHLLKSIQEAKGFDVSFDQSFQSSDFSTGIVLFKDIQQLQDRNRQLLSLLHQMKEEIEKKDFTNESSVVMDLENRLSECQKEIDALRLELAKKNEIIEWTSKQKHLINAADNSQLDSFELNENKELKAKLEKYVHEIDLVRQRNMEEVRQLEHDKNTLITENANIKAKIVELNSDLKAKKDYIDEINLTVDKYHTENTTLRERNIRLNSTVQNLEKNVIALRNQNDALNETIRQKDAVVDFAKAETVEAKNNADNYMREKARLATELENQRRLVQSLKMLQENCNKIENESMRNQAVQINHLQKEIMYYREKIEKQEEKWKKTLEDFSSRFHNQQVMLDKERNNYLKLQEQYFDLKLNSQKMQQPNETNVEHILSTQGEASTGHLRKELKTAQDEIIILKGKLINSEEACENLKSINTTLEENLNQLMKNSDEIRNSIDSERQGKLETINQLNQELQSLRSQYDQIVEEKNSEIIRLKESATTFTLQVEELKRALMEANDTIENARCNEQQVLADLKTQSVIAARAQENYENELQQRSEDAKTIFELRLNLEQSQKSLTNFDQECTKAREELNLANEAIANERKTLSDEFDKLRNRCNQLEQVNGTLIGQIDVLNNQLIALQNNSNIYLMDENHQKENASNLLSVIKFLREEKTQLQSKMSKLTDEDMCLKIEIENLKREIHTLKLALQNERQSTNRLNNLNEFNELVAKAEMVPTLSESNAQLRTQVNQLDKRCKDLLEKVNLYESKEKSLHDLSNKAEDDAVQNEFLKKQNQELREQVKSCLQQLKGFDADSVKRMMAEKSNLTRQVQVQMNEVNKLKQELESKTRSLLLNEQELNNVKQQMKVLTEDKENSNKSLTLLKEKLTGVQHTNTQLKTLARRYKQEIDTLKSVQNTEVTKPIVDKVDKEVQSDPVAIDSSTNEETLKELESKNQNLNGEIQRLKEEKETLKKHANDKEDVAKKIAQQAKQRISDIAQEKISLLKEKEERLKEINELKGKISQLENNALEKDHYLTLLKTQYESKIEQQMKELEATNKQIEDLTSQLQQHSMNQSTVVQVESPVIVALPTNQDSVMTAGPSTSVQSEVPQQPIISTIALTTVLNATKTTPTASIKPMAVTTTRSSTTLTRPGQVFAKVLPSSNETLEDGSGLVPQATVPPTQTVVTSASSTGITSSLPSTYQQSFIEISEASTSQAQQSSLFNQPSTSSGISKKRAMDTFDEPSSSNCKKVKNESEPMVVQLEEEDYSDVGASVDDRPENETTGNQDIQIIDVEQSENLEENQDENEVDSGSEDRSGEIRIIEPEFQQEFEDEQRSYEEAENEEYVDEAYENYALPAYADRSENVHVESDDEVECLDDGDDNNNGGEDEEEDEDEEEEEDDMENEEDLDEEDEEEEADEDDDDDDGPPHSPEVISIDDSDDESSSDNPATTSTRQTPDEVSSSHSSSSQRDRSSSHLSTTTNDDGSEVPQSNEPEQAGPSTSMDIAASSSRFQVSNSAEVVTSQSSLGSGAQANTTEQASSTSSQTQRVPRRPVLWPQSHDTDRQEQQPQRRRRLQLRGRGFPRRNFR